MTSKTLQEIQKIKESAEFSIKRIIQEVEKQTGCEVESVMFLCKKEQEILNSSDYEVDLTLIIPRG